MAALREFGLTYPGAHLKAPWETHLDLAVRDKTFAYLPVDPQQFSVSVKLPHSHPEALTLPFCEPTGYGLGKWGWVSAQISGDVSASLLERFKDWIDESYRAQAPKTFVKRLAKSSGR